MKDSVPARHLYLLCYVAENDTFQFESRKLKWRVSCERQIICLSIQNNGIPAPKTRPSACASLPNCRCKHDRSISPFFMCACTACCPRRLRGAALRGACTAWCYNLAVARNQNKDGNKEAGNGFCNRMQKRVLNDAHTRTRTCICTQNLVVNTQSKRTHINRTIHPNQPQVKHSIAMSYVLHCTHLSDKCHTSREPPMYRPRNWPVRKMRSEPHSVLTVPTSCFNAGMAGASGVGIDTHSSFCSLSFPCAPVSDIVRNCKYVLLTIALGPTNLSLRR